MPNSNVVMIKKLQNAINSKGYKILYNTSQFYSTEQNRPVTIYYLKRAIEDENNPKKHRYIEIFKSTSMIQIVLCLRDIWYSINNQELPTDNEEWNKLRKGIIF